MPTTDRYTFQFEEMVEMMVKRAGITEGRWTLSVEFAIGAINVSQPNTEVYKPAAIVPIVGIGIQRVAETDPWTNLMFDAGQLTK
ncbi:MAG TPA: hypothetical protein VHL58_14275 [Thermoanaerobaculia bacterium]|nr:hypothetical protein [Thermoanaerobaculia bacterium]